MLRSIAFKVNCLNGEHPKEAVSKQGEAKGIMVSYEDSFSDTKMTLGDK